MSLLEWKGRRSESERMGVARRLVYGREEHARYCCGWSLETVQPEPAATPFPLKSPFLPFLQACLMWVWLIANCWQRAGQWARLRCEAYSEEQAATIA